MRGGGGVLRGENLSGFTYMVKVLHIKRACELNKSHIISTDEDPGLRIESFAVINLRGVSTNKTIIVISFSFSNHRTRKGSMPSPQIFIQKFLHSFL